MNDEMAKLMADTTASAVDGLNKRIAALEKERTTLAGIQRQHEVEAVSTRATQNAMAERIKALEQDRDAAIAARETYAAESGRFQALHAEAIADNATLVEEVKWLRGAVAFVAVYRTESPERPASELQATLNRFAGNVLEKCKVDTSGPHPGAALLEEHRKALESVIARLPDGMRECTILFKECALGHGRLTATNWIDHGCPTCAEVRARNEGLEKAAATLIDRCEVLRKSGRGGSSVDHPRHEGAQVRLTCHHAQQEDEMSEFMRDSGHNNMRTCDDCGGAFYCGDAADRGEDAPDWTCETCTEKDSVIKALVDALWDARQYGDAPDDLCWCGAPCFATAWRNPKCEGKVATLRLAGRL